MFFFSNVLEDLGRLSVWYVLSFLDGRCGRFHSAASFMAVRGPCTSQSGSKVDLRSEISRYLQSPVSRLFGKVVQSSHGWPWRLTILGQSVPEDLEPRNIRNFRTNCQQDQQGYSCGQAHDAKTRELRSQQSISAACIENLQEKAETNVETVESNSTS